MDDKVQAHLDDINYFTEKKLFSIAAVAAKHLAERLTQLAIEKYLQNEHH